MTGIETLKWSSLCVFLLFESCTICMYYMVIKWQLKSKKLFFLICIQKLTLINQKAKQKRILGWARIHPRRNTGVICGVKERSLLQPEMNKIRAEPACLSLSHVLTWIPLCWLEYAVWLVRPRSSALTVARGVESCAWQSHQIKI